MESVPCTLLEITPDSGLVGSVTTVATGTYMIGPEAAATTDEDAVVISRRTAASAIHEAGVSAGVPGEVPANGFSTSLNSWAATFAIGTKPLEGGVACGDTAAGSVTMLCTLGVVDNAEACVFDCGAALLTLDS